MRPERGTGVEIGHTEFGSMQTSSSDNATTNVLDLDRPHTFRVFKEYLEWSNYAMSIDKRSGGMGVHYVLG